MKNPFRNLGDIQRSLGEVAVEFSHVQLVGLAASGTWRPAVNAFRCGEQFLICVELAGVARAAIEVSAEPRRLTLRGRRQVPEPSCDEAPAIQVLALEIDHGPFERVIELPEDVDAERVNAELRDGLLWVKLPLRPHS